MKNVQFWFMVLWALFMCICLTVQYPTEPTCFKQVCPSGTSDCKRQIKSTTDKRLLKVRISCLDDLGGSLKEYYFEEASKDPNVHYESSSFVQADGGASSQPFRRFDLGSVYVGEDFL